MTRYSPTTDVADTVRKVVEVDRNSKISRFDYVPYGLVVSILRDQYGYTEHGAHALIFEAHMSGVVSLELAKVQSFDRKEQLCLTVED